MGKDFKEQLTEEDLEDFFHSFGEYDAGIKGANCELSLPLSAGGILPTEVSLGGRLYGSEPQSSEKQDQILERKKALKSSLSASFTAPMVGASITTSHANEDTTSIGISSTGTRQDLSIETHGGNALVSWR
jgi:hypothetical protein